MESDARTRPALKYRVIGVLGAALVWLICKTMRITIIGRERADSVRGGGGRVVFALWHAELLLLSYVHRFQRVQVIISQHGDGEIIAQVTRRLGYGSVRGSTTRGGMRALAGMIRKAAAGYDIAFTPDGPRGPRHVVQPGVIYAAQRSGLPILPIAGCASRQWAFKSWDRFQVPKPFSKGYAIYGEPISVPREATDEEIEQYRLQLEDALNQLSAHVEQIACRGDRLEASDSRP